MGYRLNIGAVWDVISCWKCDNLVVVKELHARIIYDNYVYFSL